MRRALLVGIDDYGNPAKNLNSCINDALHMQKVFETHENGDKNFACKMLLSNNTAVTRASLKAQIKKLFNHGKGTALFYFSGHGATTEAGTYLVTQDHQPNDEGVSLMEVVALANNSEADEVIIILDCCYAGDAGNNIDLSERKVILREGVSILAASAANQYSYVYDGLSRFTGIIYNALSGGGADITGKTTLSGMYYYADTLLNAWKQRPVFKSHVSHMISLRNCEPKISLETLRKLPNYFPEKTTGRFLSSANLESLGGKNEAMLSMMIDFREYHANGLLMPIGVVSLDEAAVQNKECRLTPLGEYYKNLAIERML